VGKCLYLEYDIKFTAIIEKLSTFLSSEFNTPHFSNVKIKIRIALVFHSKLTLEELNEVTSIPNGTLYENLMVLIEKGIIQREQIPNSRKFVYKMHEDVDILGFSLSKEQYANREKRIQKLFKMLQKIEKNSSKLNPSDLFFVNQVKEYTFYRMFGKYYHEIKVSMNLPKFSEKELNLIKSLDYDYDSNTLAFPLEKVEFSPSIGKVEEEFISDILIPGFSNELPGNMELVLSRFHSRKILTFPILLRLTSLSKSSLSLALKDLVEKKLVNKIPGDNTKSGRPIYYIPSLPKETIEDIAQGVEYLLKELNEFREMKVELARNRNKMSHLNGYHQIYTILDTIIEFYYPYWEKIGEFCVYMKSLMLKNH
jgi:predicted transcriptional regulator